MSNKRTSFYSVFLSAALGLLVAGPVTAAQINVVLGFGGSTCVGPCGNGAQVSQDAGDVAGVVDVIFDAKRDTGPPQEAFLFWDSGFVGTNGVAYTVGGGVARISLVPADGYQVTLNSLDWTLFSGSGVRQFDVSVRDEGENLLWTSFDLGIGNLSSTLVNIDASDLGLLSSSGALHLDIVGDPLGNVGVDNINFTVSQVPLPAAAWLFGSALLGLGWMRRASR